MDMIPGVNMQKYVETLTAKLILSGDISTDSRIILDVENGELTAHAEKVQPHKQEAAMIPKDPVMLLSYVNSTS